MSRAQLLALGLSSRAVVRRMEWGWLHPLHRGVYAVGHRSVTREGRWMAAVLAAGNGAVLSHRSAAAAWGLRTAQRSRIEVTVARALRSRRGIETHRARIAPDETTTRDGVPVTTIGRTLLDLAAILPNAQLERAVERAEALRLTDRLPLDALLERYPRRPGARALAEIVASGRAMAIATRSELEDRFLTLLDDRRLPRPEVNETIAVDGREPEVDFVWRTQRLAVELDGRATHATAAAFERDRARDRALQAAGWRVIRITWRQLRYEPDSVARDLRRLLRA